MNPFKRAIELLRAKSYDILFYNRPDDDLPKTWSKSDYLTANEISLYTNRAIAKRAEKVSEIEFVIKKGDEKVETHPLLALLNKPNDLMTGLQFWGLYQKYRDLTGAAYIWMEPGGAEGVFDKTKKIKALHLLRPDCVSPVFEGGTIRSFRHTLNSNTVEFPAEQIIYLYTPDPKKPLEGVSLLKAGILTIDTEHQLARYHANVIRNGGNVGNIMTFKTPSLTKQQVSELKEAYAAQYAEAKNGGKPMFLGGEADIKKLNLNPDELSYIESKRLTLDDVCIMTGTPKAVLGLTSGETFANADAAIAVFQRETVKPLMKDLTTILDWRLVPDDLDLSFVDPTPEDVELRLKRAETGIKNSYMTINEARELEGLEPVPNGDAILVPFNLIPLERVGEEAEEQDEPEEKEKEKRAPAAHPLRD